GLASAVALSYVGASLACVIYIYRRERLFVGDVVLWPSIFGVGILSAVLFGLQNTVNSAVAAMIGIPVVAALTVIGFWRAMKRNSAFFQRPIPETLACAKENDQTAALR